MINDKKKSQKMLKSPYNTFPTVTMSEYVLLAGISIRLKSPTKRKSLMILYPVFITVEGPK